MGKNKYVPINLEYYLSDNGNFVIFSEIVRKLTLLFSFTKNDT